MVQTYFRWRKEYVCLQGGPGRRLKERENAKLKRLVAELSLDKLVVEGHRLGNF
jgi:putative transposase